MEKHTARGRAEPCRQLPTPLGLPDSNGSIARPGTAPIRRFPDGRWQTGLTPGRIMESTDRRAVENHPVRPDLCHAQNMDFAVPTRHGAHGRPGYFRRLGSTSAPSIHSAKDARVLQHHQAPGPKRPVRLRLTDSVAAMVPETEMDGTSRCQMAPTPGSCRRASADQPYLSPIAAPPPTSSSSTRPATRSV